MIKDGKGGGKTTTGLRFEERTDLKTIFSKIPGYTVKANEVLFDNSTVAKLYKKHALYKELLVPKGVVYQNIISKQLLPDDTILVLKNKTLFIIEMKFQETEGSVDEKLQTCDFKNKQYHRLLQSLGVDVKYVYILNDWFRKEQYKDVLDYIHSVGCYYFFNELPLEFLGLPKPE